MRGSEGSNSSVVEASADAVCEAGDGDETVFEEKEGGARCGWAA